MRLPAKMCMPQSLVSGNALLLPRAIEKWVHRKTEKRKRRDGEGEEAMH
jgi:hypothetical protein